MEQENKNQDQQQGQQNNGEKPGNNQNQENNEQDGQEQLSIEEAIRRAEEKVKDKKDNDTQNSSESQTKGEEENPGQDPAPEKEIKPLSFWNEGQKQFFQKLNPEEQKTVLSMFHGVQKVYEKKTIELNEKQKALSDIEKVFKPYDDIFAKQKINKAEYIKNFIELDRKAAQDPIGFVVEFMAAKKLNLDHIYQGIAKYAERVGNPLYRRTMEDKERIKKLEAEINDKKTAEINKVIENFKNTKDENGAPKYPLFEDVKDVMAKISAVTGETDLEKLYDDAIWSNSSTREKLFAEKEKQNKEKELQAQKVAKAKAAAGFAFSNSKGVGGNKKVKSLREIIAENDAD